jgi:hypothetical protein
MLRLNRTRRLKPNNLELLKGAQLEHLGEGDIAAAGCVD